MLEKYRLHGLKVTCSLRHVILFSMVKVLLHVGGSAADVSAASRTCQNIRSGATNTIKTILPRLNFFHHLSNLTGSSSNWNLESYHSNCVRSLTGLTKQRKIRFTAERKLPTKLPVVMPGFLQ